MPAKKQINLNAKMLPLSDIRADDDFNCRDIGDITPQTVSALARDIKKNGLMQPIVVGPIEEDGKRLLVAGYRRYMAHKVNKASEIFCTIRDDLTDHSTLLMVNLRENTQRSELDIVQVSRVVGKLLDKGMTEQQIQSELNQSRGWVQVRKMIFALPEEIYPQVKDGTFTSVNIRELYSSLLEDTTEAFIEKVKWLKGEKEKGRKGATLKTLAKAKDEKVGFSYRTREELYKMQTRLQQIFGRESFGAALLAWASGNTNLEMLNDAIQEECDIKEIPFKD